MLRGIFQRVAVAIVLMGALLAPSGICLHGRTKLRTVSAYINQGAINPPGQIAVPAAFL
jgi:hypothetical protein